MRARTDRGAFAHRWWSRRWVEALEAVGWAARLARGRRYARQGQVLEVVVAPGLLRARVQGSRPTPYQVAVRLPLVPPEAWRRAAEAVRGHAGYVAELLAGGLPEALEGVLAAAGVSLLPAGARELEVSCTCPDPVRPCKHVAAVCYLVGEELDRDPFLLFRLRGMDRTGFLALLRLGEGPEDAPPPEEPLLAEGASAASFWEGGGVPEAVARWLAASQPPREAGALVRRLGDPPFWRAGIGLGEALGEVYGRAAGMAAEVLRGEALGEAAPAPTAATKSRDRAALEAELAAGVPVAELRRRYDGRVLRAALRRRGLAWPPA